MGEVWTCRDRKLRRDVAVKLLALDAAVSPDAQQRFEIEAVAAAQINHPNVVALHDSGVDKDWLYLVMERVDGTTLAAYLREHGPLPPGRALEIAEQICAALVAAHQAKVVHYDIKPLNVMITPDDRLKVVDFGIAGFVQTTFTIAGSGDQPTAGTPEYGAPEQFTIERGDERSDLYALGGLLFTLLTGRPPFTGDNGFAVVQRKLAEEAPPVVSIRQGVPPAVNRLVGDLLRRDPAGRPGTAAEVHYRIIRLRTALDALELADAPTENISVTAPPTRRLGNDFQLTWTGRERHRSSGGLLGVAISWSLVLALAVLAVILLIVDGHELDDWGDLIDDANPGFLPAMIAVVLALAVALPLTLRARRVRRARPWSLQVDSVGITTVDADFPTAATGPSGRRTYRWDGIKTVTFEKILSSTGYREPGLHLAFTTKGPRPERPAGWRYRVTPIVRQDGRTPVCVLGPLDEQQHAEVTTALTRHGGSRWRPEVD